MDWVLGAAGGFWRIARELSPGAIAREAEQAFCLLISGEAGAGRSTLRGALNGARWPTALTLPYVRLVERIPPESYGASLALHVMDASRGLFRGDWEGGQALQARGVPVVYVYNKLDLVANPRAFREAARASLGGIGPVAFVEASDAESVRRHLAPAVLRAAPGLRLALGRRLPGLRPAAARSVIQETAVANLQFAILSSLPANIPLVGIASAGADLAVLTKNQAMMLLKLAAVHGRPLDSRLPLFLEIAPVVGGAFLWRTAARTAVGLLPGALAAAPKGVIAFVGTYVVGRAAEHYYRLGLRPSREALDRYAGESLALARRALPRLSRPALPRLRLRPPPGPGAPTG